MLIENSSTTKAKMMGGVPERQVLGRNGRRPQERVVQPAARSGRPSSIQIAAIRAGRYALCLRATWIGSDRYAKTAAPFPVLLFALCVRPASKRQLAERVIRHSDVNQQNCRRKTKFCRQEGGVVDGVPVLSSD